jgi:hypothetical protein
LFSDARSGSQSGVPSSFHVSVSSAWSGTMLVASPADIAETAYVRPTPGRSSSGAVTASAFHAFSPTTTGKFESRTSE